MIGISSAGKDGIANIVDDMFDKIALQFVGNIPKLRNKKLLILNSKPHFGLAHLYVQAMENQAPNAVEQDVLKSLLNSAYGYIESLKNKTASNVVERVDGLIKEAKARGYKVTKSQVAEVLGEEMVKAKSHLKAIAESESTKTRNVGTMMDISRKASNQGDYDPSVFFVVVKDDRTCRECIRLHLMPDGVTPRVWKFSELKQGYHKRGEDTPSVFGLHPHCRCVLSYLANGYGFDKKGWGTYINREHNEHEKQKK